MRLAARFIFRTFVQNSLQHFISFLSRERKETKQRKETAARAKFASAHGAPPLSLKCLRHLFTELLRYDAFLPLKAARRVGAPEALCFLENERRGAGEFCTGGPPYSENGLELGVGSLEQKAVSPAAMIFIKKRAERAPI